MAVWFDLTKNYDLPEEKETIIKSCLFPKNTSSIASHHLLLSAAKHPKGAMGKAYHIYHEKAISLN